MQSPNATILTANSRLARYLQQEFAKKQTQPTETPSILPLSTWLEKLFHQTNTVGSLLLSDFQAQCLWEEIILQSKLTDNLLQPTQMTKLVKQAFDILTDYQIPLETLSAFQSQPEVNCLLIWIAQFQKRCLQNNWVNPCELPYLLQQRDIKNPITLPPKIILMGFDDINPSLTQLFSQWENRITIETETLTVPHAIAKKVILNDPDHELKTMAQWAKTQWDKNPTAQIGCVIPDLANKRAQVQRVFAEIFCIDAILPGTTTETMPFNISAGIPLSQHNMIETALTLLRWCHTQLPIEILSHIVQSPYFCRNEDEKNQGAQMDAQLREKNHLTVSVGDLYAVMPLSWRSRFDAFITHFNEKKFSETLPSVWASHFTNLLKAIGWPSTRTQNSTEFQVLERFKKCLFEFSQLDYFFPKINFKHALHLLTTLTQQTLFQPKSHHESIQIMGTLEASSILFDAMWVMGLHDGIWPAPTKPHPLIPQAIQQQFNTPHATAKRELQFYTKMTTRLITAAEYVIFSSPEKEGDQYYSPSKLIDFIPLVDKNTFDFNDQNITQEIFFTKKIESFEDHNAPIISDFSTIQGGSSILKLQALCPFRAFASIRLKAKTLNSPTIGIPAMAKGVMIHEILCTLWNELKDQQALSALTETELNDLIEKHIENTFLKIKNHTHQDYFYSVEKMRLKNLIRKWLLFEKERPYFRVIANESSCDIKINQLPLQIRLDRIDQLNDGSLFLIDYKTGSNSITGWFQERLTDPQLPIYAAFAPTAAYASIAFAEVRNADIKFKGVAQESIKTISGIIPINKIKNAQEIFSWETLIATWKKSLEQLSDDFCNGHAIVDPIKPEVCLTCDLKSVCRIN